MTSDWLQEEIRDAFRWAINGGYALDEKLTRLNETLYELINKYRLDTINLHWLLKLHREYTYQCLFSKPQSIYPSTSTNSQLASSD